MAASVPRVLVVDDMLSIRALVRVFLMEFGLSFDEASDGAEALRKARAVRPDLIIADLQMPVMDGRALVEALRGDPNLREVPVIVLTGSGEGEVGDPLPGRTEVVFKPIDPASLKQVVRRALGQA